MSLPRPSRGEVWFVNLDPAEGREQTGSRPALVVSVDPFNHGPADLVVILPITSKSKGIPFHVAIEAPAGGLERTSFVKCADIRCVWRGRFCEGWGAVGSQVLAEVEDRLRILMGL